MPRPTIHLICVMPYFWRLEEIERREAVLAEDKSVYNEWGYAISVYNPYMSVIGPSTRVLDMFTT